MYPSSVSSWRLRWPLLVGLLAVLAAGVVYVIASDLRAPERAKGKAAFARAPQFAPLLPPPRVPATVAHVPAQRSARVTVKAAQPGAGEAEVCGLGIVKVSEQDSSGAEKIPEVARQRTWDRLREVFAASADERLRAIGWVIDARSTSASAAAARNALAGAAVGSTDGFVYALAIQVCNSLDIERASEGACQLVSAEQWTRVDPHNAVPWLSLAALARARRDGAGEAEAVYRASLAQVSDSHWGVLPKMINQVLPADLPPISRTIALIDSFGIQAAFREPAHLVANGHCAAEAVRDSNLRQVCDQLAKLLLDKGRTALDPRVGRAIGERVGWPAERVQALREEQLMLEHTAAEHVAGSTVLSCENVTRLTQWAAQVAELGEPGASRELLKRAGKSTEQALAEHRERARAAQAAASAASGVGEGQIATAMAGVDGAAMAMNSADGAAVATTSVEGAAVAASQAGREGWSATPQVTPVER